VIEVPAIPGASLPLNGGPESGPPLFTDDHSLWVAWAAAWLREYECQTRYLSLLALEAAEDVELRLAWLQWWQATCDCRDASRRLDGNPV
jgi:hypothetical protein